ncbi:MAG: hypothetical protein GVY30_08310 [Chloroflexi bacterium]|nr:hypothetical protein [Chloroflexota bacterium]
MITRNQTLWSFVLAIALLLLLPSAQATQATVATTQPWWTQPCNTPAYDWPDGCPEFRRVQRPRADEIPLPPPCINSAYTETISLEGRQVVQLTVVVDHPEYDYGMPQEFGLIPENGQWVVHHIDREFKCGWDTAPLAWWTREALNGATMTLSSYAIYERALPRQFYDLLGLESPYRDVYLPVIVSQ